MPDATTTIETVTVVRPLKVISLICELLALLMLLLSLSTCAWLKAGSYFKTGLFRECTFADPAGNLLPVGAPPSGICQPSRIILKAYFQITAALLVLAAAGVLAGVCMTAAGLRTVNYGQRYLFYRIAMYLSLIALLAEIISLIVFPVCFYLELENWSGTTWELDWSYGVGWGGSICTFFACLLLIADKEHEEVYYKEKTVYTNSHMVV
uniref:Transmembrane protein 47 n=1 Tax=Trichuris muris TaxID=70415 RepID=A0A5S6Q6P4_TRIMR